MSLQSPRAQRPQDAEPHGHTSVSLRLAQPPHCCRLARVVPYHTEGRRLFDAILGADLLAHLLPMRDDRSITTC